MNFDCYAVIDTDHENQHTGFDLYEDRNDAQNAFDQIIDDIQDAYDASKEQTLPHQHKIIIFVSNGQPARVIELVPSYIN